MFGRSSRNFRGNEKLLTCFAKIFAKSKFRKIKRNFVFSRNEKSPFRFNPIHDADPEDVDCHSGGLLLIYVPDAVDLYT
jgi:hypothetical protein